MIDVTEMNEVIRKAVKKLENTEVGSEEYRTTADTLVKILDRTTEMERVNQETIDKEKARERAMKNDILEYNLKCEQLADEHKNEVVKHIITIGTTVLTVIVSVWGVKVSLKFEEEGTITTNAGRSFFNGIFNFFRKK